MRVLRVFAGFLILTSLLHVGSAAAGVIPFQLLFGDKTDQLLIDNNSDGIANPGDTLRYTIAITYENEVDETNVVFTDTPDANTTLVVGSVTTSQGTVTSGNTAGDTAVSVDIGTLVALAAVPVTVTFDVVIVNPLDPDVTEVANQGTVSGDNEGSVPTDDPDTLPVNDATITPVVAAPVVSVSKTDTLLLDGNSDGIANPGDTLRYSVTIANDGGRDATALVFSDTPDANTGLLAGSVTTSQGTVISGNTAGDTTVSVDIGTLAGAGGSLTITFDALVNNPFPAGINAVSNQGNVSGGNSADVLSDDPDSPGNADPTLTPVTVLPVLSISKTDVLQIDVDNNGLVDPGDSLRYSVTIANSGDGAANAAIFTDTPDANTTLAAGSVTTTQGTVTSGNSAGDTAVTIDIGTIAAGGTVTVTFDVTVVSPLPIGITQISNQGTLSGTGFTDVLSDDPDIGGSSDPTVTPVGAEPVLSISKTDALQTDVDANGLTDPGDTLRYSILITNSGNQDAATVLFNDTPDANTLLTAGSVTTTQGTINSGNTAGDASVTVDIGTLGAGAGVTITFDVSINAPLPDGVTQVSNQANLSGANFPDVLSDDPDSPGTADPTLTAVNIIIDDGDGVPPVIEDLVPNQSDNSSGDGNGDGTFDSLQPHVTSLMTFDSSAMVTIANEATQFQQLDFNAIAPLPDAPADVVFPFGMFEFTISGVPAGASVSMAVYLPLTPEVDNYYKRDDQGQWQNVAQTVTVIGNKRLVTFELLDNGPFDSDPTLGIIRDPGGPAVVGIAPVAPAIPTLSEWMQLMLLLLLLGTGWYYLVNRRHD